MNLIKKLDLVNFVVFRLLDWIFSSLLYVIWNLVNVWVVYKSIIEYGVCL